MRISTRWTKDSCKVVYLHGQDRQLAAIGLTTEDNWIGIRGMLVVGGFKDCTGGRRATRAWHFPLAGLPALGSYRRRPLWLWRPIVKLCGSLQSMVDTRYRKL